MTEPGGSTDVGSIVAYLRFNREDWTRGVRDTEQDSSRLGRLNPHIRIDTNATQAVAQLATVAGAVRALQDAQGRAAVAQQRLDDLRARGNASASQIRAAEERVAAASRSVEESQIRLAAAYQRSDEQARRAAESAFRVADSTDRVGQSADRANRPVISLVGALALIAPAAVPIAGVAGGALLGLVPTLATVAFGVKGVSDEMKSGALQGTQYGKDLHVIGQEADRLKAIAAGGLLSGIDRGLASSHGLFRVVNSDVGQMSGQLGDIVAGAAPGLLRILTQLNPLFTTFGDLLANGAHHLEDWAQHTTGVESFVHYVQGELPDVMHLLGNLVELLSHVAQGAAPFGGVMLHSLVLFTDALNAIPVDVLRVLIPLAVNARLAFLGWQVISTIVRAVGSSFKTASTQVQGFADRHNVAMLEVQAAEARTASETATAERAASLARLQAAQQAVQAAREQVTAAGEISDAAVNEARTVLAAKEEEAAAAKGAADAAILAAREQAAASEAAARRSVAAADAQKAGMSAAIAPAGALIGILGLVGLAFLSAGGSADTAATANENYADSVKHSTDALNQYNLTATAKTLSDAHALDVLDQLKSGNTGLTTTYGDLINAVNGTDRQYQSVIGTLKQYTDVGRGSSAQDARNAAAALSLIHILGQSRTALHGNIKEQIALNQAQRESQHLASGGSQAAQAMADRLGVTGKAYLAARSAAQKSTAQTRAQTLAFQLENNAASLLTQALQTLRGQNLNVAQAQTALGQSVHTVIDAMRKGKTQIEGNSKEALNNQQAIEGNVSAARQLAQAVAQQTGSNDKAAASYRASKQALLDQLKAQGELTPAIRDYVNKLYDVKGISDYLSAHPTKLDADKHAAEAALATLRSEMRAYAAANPETHIYADTSRAVASVQSLVRNIDGTVAYVQVQTTGPGGPSGGRAYFDNPQHKASGGDVRGPGGPKADRVPIMASNGEFVSTADSNSRNNAALKAGNAGATLAVVGHYANGGTVGDVYKVGKGWGFQGSYYAKKHDAEQARRDAVNNARAAAIYNKTQDHGPSNLQVARATFASQHSHRILERGGQFFYQGQQYDNRRLAAEARREALIEAGRQAVTKTLHGKGGVTGIAQLIRSQIPGAGKAMADLSKALDKAFELKGVKADLADARAQLADMKSYRSGLISTYSGSFDPTQYGTIAGLIGGLHGATSGNNSIAAEIKKLRGEHLNKNYLQKLISEGNTTTLALLAGGSAGDIAQVNKALGGYNASLGRIGNAGVVQKFGESVNEQKRDINKLVGRVDRLTTRIDHFVDAAADLTHRPIEVDIDGKAVARASGKHHAHELRRHAGRQG